MTYGGYCFYVRFDYADGERVERWVVAKNVKEAIYLAKRDLENLDYVHIETVRI